MGCHNLEDWNFPIKRVTPRLYRCARGIRQSETFIDHDKLTKPSVSFAQGCLALTSGTFVRHWLKRCPTTFHCGLLTKQPTCRTLNLGWVSVTLHLSSCYCCRNKRHHGQFTEAVSLNVTCCCSLPAFLSLYCKSQNWVVFFYYFWYKKNG